MQTVKYFNLVGDEEDIGNERFKWSRASTFSYNRNAIGLAVAYASAIRTHLSVHGTAHPTSAASVRPRSAADCLIHSAVDISYHRHQGCPSASSSAVSDSVRSDIIIDLGTGTVGGGCLIINWWLSYNKLFYLSLKQIYNEVITKPTLCQQEAPVRVQRQRVHLNLQNEGGYAGVNVCL